MPIGFTSGEVPSLAMNLPLLKNYSIVGVFAGAWKERFPNEMARAADIVMAWVGEGKLHPRIDRVLPVEGAAEAMSAARLGALNLCCKRRSRCRRLLLRSYT